MQRHPLPLFSLTDAALQAVVKIVDGAGCHFANAELSGFIVQLLLNAHFCTY